MQNDALMHRANTNKRIEHVLTVGPTCDVISHILRFLFSLCPLSPYTDYHQLCTDSRSMTVHDAVLSHGLSCCVMSRCRPPTSKQHTSSIKPTSGQRLVLLQATTLFRPDVGSIPDKRMWHLRKIVPALSLFIGWWTGTLEIIRCTCTVLYTIML